MKTLAVIALVLAPLALASGCDKMTAAKERAALLTCANNGGFKSYKPDLTALVVVCNDGTTRRVKWLP